MLQITVFICQMINGKMLLKRQISPVDPRICNFSDKKCDVQIEKRTLTFQNTFCPKNA